MKIKEEWKTAFRTRYDFYKYIIILFKLINVSSSCQELLNDIL